MSQPTQTTAMPVTIISGFLGAGKTTLLNRVLKSDHGLRIGVIVNDFGSLAFEEELAGAASSHQRMLANGCVCCSIQNDLIGTIADLLGLEPPLDAIVIEASGIADPVSLVTTLATPGLERPVRVRSVVTVAGADQLREQEQDYGGELVLRQLRAASLIVLNKRDLVEPGALSDTRDWLNTISVHGEVIEAVHCDVPLQVVLGDRELEGPATSSATHDLQPQFAEWTLQTEKAFTADQLMRIFERVPAGLVRAKGIAELPQGEGRLLVQFAGGRLDLSPAHDGGTDGHGTRIVVIGSPVSLDPVALEELFKAET